MDVERPNNLTAGVKCINKLIKWLVVYFVSELYYYHEKMCLIHVCVTMPSIGIATDTEDGVITSKLSHSFKPCFSVYIHDSRI